MVRDVEKFLKSNSAELVLRQMVRVVRHRATQMNSTLHAVLTELFVKADESKDGIIQPHELAHVAQTELGVRLTPKIQQALALVFSGGQKQLPIITYSLWMRVMSRLVANQTGEEAGDAHRRTQLCRAPPTPAPAGLRARALSAARI